MVLYGLSSAACGETGLSKYIFLVPFIPSGEKLIKQTTNAERANKGIFFLVDTVLNMQYVGEKNKE